MKLGIMGGTFNPPHWGHLYMARCAAREAGLDEVLWIPNGDPPHKRPEVSAEDRLEMTRLLIAGEEGMSVSDLEIRREGRSYMAETLEILHEERPDAQLYLICGADMLAGITCWYRAQRVFELADILVFQRAGLRGADRMAQSLARFSARITFMEGEIPEISSTDIRALLHEDAAGSADAKELVPERVLSYIRGKKLYLQPGLDK